MRRSRRRGRPRHPDVLTPAEWAVLEHLRAGLTNGEIAARLGLSVNTVRTHVSSMLAKTGLEDREQLARWQGRPAPASRLALARRRLGSLAPLDWLRRATAGRGALGPVAVAVAAVVLAAVAFAAIPRALSGGATLDGSGAMPEEGGAGSGTSPTGGVFAEMLRLVPDEQPREWTAIEMGDLARYRELAGIGPGDDLDSQAYIEMLVAPSDVPFPDIGFIIRGPPWVPQLSDMTRRTLGFGVQDVDQWLRVGLPDRSQFVIRGDFHPDRVEDLLADCAECPPAQTFDHRGTTVYAWGGDNDLGAGSPLSPPMFDNLGRGCCLAIQERYVLRAYTRADVMSMLDAQAGEGSLADDDDFRLAAEGLDRIGTLDALITDFTFDRARAEDIHRQADPDDPVGARVREALTMTPETVLLRPYSLLAFGNGYAQGEPFGAVVLVHPTEDAARANEERLRRRFDEALVMRPVDGPRQTWAEKFDRIEIELDGRVLRVRLWGDTLDPFTPFEGVPFIHE